MADFDIFNDYWNKVDYKDQDNKIISRAGAWVRTRRIPYQTLKGFDLSATALTRRQIDRLRYFFDNNRDRFTFEDPWDIVVPYSTDGPHEFFATIYGEIPNTDLIIRVVAGADTLVEKTFVDHFVRGVNPDVSLIIPQTTQSFEIQFIVSFKTTNPDSEYAFNFISPFHFLEGEAYRIPLEFNSLTLGTDGIDRGVMGPGGLYIVVGRQLTGAIEETIVATITPNTSMLQRVRQEYTVIFEDGKFSPKLIPRSNLYNINLSLIQVDPTL